MQIAEKSTKVAPFAEIRECPTSGSKSLHATVEFMPGQEISKFGAKEVVDKPNYLTVQISDSEHIMLDPDFLQYINHSCEPNVFFEPSEGLVTALRKINIDEELTFFYPSTEWSMDRAFDCICNSEACLGCIQGAAHLPPNILAKYKLSKYIKQKVSNLGVDSQS